MFKDYFYYIFSPNEIGKINIAIVNRWSWIANEQLEEIDDKDLINKLELIKESPGLYSPSELSELSNNDLQLRFSMLGFTNNDDLENFINNLYPHNYS